MTNRFTGGPSAAAPGRPAPNTPTGRIADIQAMGDRLAEQLGERPGQESDR